MALTQISNVIVPEIFYDYITKDTMVKSAIFQSGIVKNDPTLASHLAGGGRTFNVPNWNDLDNTESGVASDAPGTTATPGNLTASNDVAIRQVRTRGWSTADLAGLLAGSDPMARIRDRVSAYWTRQFQTSLISTLTGVYLSNVANNSGDMAYTIGNDSSSAVTSAELISAEAILAAKQTMGDAADSLKIIVMHSVVYTRLQVLNLIDFTWDSDGKIKFATYLGYYVVVDDGCPAVAGSNRTMYTSYLLGDGAFGFGESANNLIPVEVRREPNQGNGMGVEILWTRRQFVLHPYGIKFADSSVAGQFPTNAELATAANWTRVYQERKQVPIVFLRTNG